MAYFSGSKRKKTTVSRYNKYIAFFKIDADNPYTLDDGGNRVPNYVEAFKRWCEGKSVLSSASGKVESDASVNRKRVRLSTRYTEKVTEDMLFEYKGEVYNITYAGDADGWGWETVIFGEVKADGGRL